LNIVLIGPVYPYRGGIAHYTTMLYRALKARGHEVLLISFKRQYPQWLFPGQSDRDPSESPLRVGEACYWIDSLNPFTWWCTFARIRQYTPDAVVLQWWTPFWAPVWWLLGMLIRRRLRRPLAFICHNVLPHEAHRWDREVARAVLRWGEYFVVQSAEERARLLALLPQAWVDIVPHPVYDMFAGAPLSQAEARAMLGLPPDVPVLLFFGIVREYKGLMDLLEALPAIREALGEVLLLVVGEFWDSSAFYRERIAALGLADAVRLVDRYVLNEEVPPYFYAADLVVAPYRQATGSGVVQTAIGFGAPLLTTVAGLFDGLTLPAGCLLVPPQDSAALATAVIDFLSQPAAARRDAGTRPLQAAFSWERLVEALEGALVRETAR